MTYNQRQLPLSTMSTLSTTWALIVWIVDIVDIVEGGPCGWTHSDPLASRYYRRPGRKGNAHPICVVVSGLTLRLIKAVNQGITVNFPR